MATILTLCSTKYIIFSNIFHNALRFLDLNWNRKSTEFCHFTHLWRYCLINLRTENRVFHISIFFSFHLILSCMCVWLRQFSLWAKVRKQWIKTIYSATLPKKSWWVTCFHFKKDMLTHNLQFLLRQPNW